jgi:carboxymethylenebutenolidase
MQASTVTGSPPWFLADPPSYDHRMTEPAINARQNVTFASNGAAVHGYLAVPESGSGPGVIVIQEWWGLDDHIVDVCGRLAAAGFVALAPDLYGGRVAHGADDAGSLMQELPVDGAARDLAGAVDYLLAHDSVTSSTVGAVGFCMGGGFVLLLAAQQGDRVSAAVPFYGVGPAVPDTYTGLTAAVQGHYGEQDGFYPVDGARRQEQQIRDESAADVEFFYYPAGHAFNNDQDRMGTYDAASAGLAWSRTLDFLRANVT